MVSFHQVNFLSRSSTVSCSEIHHFFYFGRALNEFWIEEGKRKGYFATFVTICAANANQMQIKLVDESEIPAGQAHHIYALHKAPLKDRQTQLGMMNVPIILPPSLKSEHIKAPPVTASVLAPPQEDIEMALEEKAEAIITETIAKTTIAPAPANASTTTVTPTVHQQTAPGKRMKMVKTTRTFTENGYQMTEIVNEMVPCEDNDPDAVSEEISSGKDLTASKTKAAAAAPGKQSNLMSFFKKAN